MNIIILYSCDLCDSKDIPVVVESRKNESIVDWLHATVFKLADNHSKRSPTCQATHISQIKIPIDKNAKIGSINATEN